MDLKGDNCGNTKCVYVLLTQGQYLQIFWLTMEVGYHNKVIIPNCNNDIICLGLLNVSRIDYFGLELLLAYQTSKDFCMYIFSMELSHVFTISIIILLDWHQTWNKLIVYQSIELYPLIE